VKSHHSDSLSIATAPQGLQPPHKAERSAIPFDFSSLAWYRDAAEIHIGGVMKKSTHY
jgi:hypothetical protein